MNRKLSSCYFECSHLFFKQERETFCFSDVQICCFSFLVSSDSKISIFWASGGNYNMHFSHSVSLCRHGRFKQTGFWNGVLFLPVEVVQFNIQFHISIRISAPLLSNGLTAMTAWYLSKNSRPNWLNLATNCPFRVFAIKNFFAVTVCMSRCVSVRVCRKSNFF